MLVTKRNFDALLTALEKEKVIGFDSETTCLSWWQNPWLDGTGIHPRIFAMQFATERDTYYLDFHHSSDRLDDQAFAKINSELTQNPDKIWFIANAKFDLHHCQNHGVEFAGTIHCTQAQARVLNNLEPKLSLDDLSQKYLKAEKLDVISKLKERGHFTKIPKFGGQFEDALHFDRLTLEELVQYGERDSRLCFDLGVYQVREILKLDQEIFAKLPGANRFKLSDVMKNEHALTKVLFKMERDGIKIDRAYTEKAYSETVKEYKTIEEKLNSISGAPTDWLSAKQLKPIFERLNIPYTYTEKGNASFDSDALESSDSELAKLILQYRFLYKRAHTYFANFLQYADRNDVIHASIQQSGTMFGRMSSWQPNLFNIPNRTDKEEAEYKVRRCFIPKYGFKFVEFDYKGAEYFLTNDYARQMDVVEMLQNGLDPHAKLATDLGITRQDAKTLNFAILYGAGQERIGKMLGYKGEEAKRVGKQKKNDFFKRLPNVASLIMQVSNTAAQRGHIFNWFGRLLKYDRETSYKATNGLIQSGVADITKIALVKIAPLLQGTKSTMISQIYDAILFEMHPDDLHLLPEIKRVMCDVYPQKVLKMQVDAKVYEKNWFDA